MENCLVTKLKGSVNAKSLPRFGYVRIKLTGGTPTNVRRLYINVKGKFFIYDENFNVVDEGIGAGIYDPSNPALGQYIINCDENQTKYADIEEGNILRLEGFTIKEVNGEKNCNKLFSQNTKKIDVGSTPLYCNVDTLNYTELLSVNLYGTQSIGSLENFAVAQINSGRNNGTVLLNISKSNVTFHNNITSGGAFSLAFENNKCTVTLSDSVVATYNNGSWSYNS